MRRRGSWGSGRKDVELGFWEHLRLTRCRPIHCSRGKRSEHNCAATPRWLASPLTAQRKVGFSERVVEDQPILGVGQGQQAVTPRRRTGSNRIGRWGMRFPSSRKRWFVTSPTRQPARLSFSEDDCTSSRGLRPRVQPTPERAVSAVLCTKHREKPGLPRSLMHGAADGSAVSEIERFWTG